MTRILETTPVSILLEYGEGENVHWIDIRSWLPCGRKSNKVPEPYFDYVECSLPCDHAECGIAIRHRMGELDDEGNEIRHIRKWQMHLGLKSPDPLTPLCSNLECQYHATNTPDWCYVKGVGCITGKRF